MSRLIICTVICAIVLTACGNDKQEKELTDKEKNIRDSISRVQQRKVSDSLRKTNPLLIVPPDSTYTGTYIDKYPSGITKYTGFFRLGKRHGQWMSFYPDGEIWSEMHYDKGLRQGPNMTYFEKGGMRYSGFYKNDEQDSIWSYFDSTGKLAEKVLFRRNRIIKNLLAE